MFFQNELGSTEENKDIKSEIDTGSVGVAFSSFLDTAAANGITGIFSTLKDITTKVKEEISSIISIEAQWSKMKFLDSESADIIKSLGLGSQKADEFRKMVADGASKFAKIGLSVDKVGDTYLEIASVFATNISVSTEDLTELAATAKVTGQSGKELASAFRGVGVDVAGIGPKMLEVAKIARESGVAVSAVSAGVVKNMDKMNLYNFEGGIKGLAKMSAQASKLGIDMSQIFALTEKVFNPEGAIETAAALQRLGVSTSALIDPLSLMDMSQNDPTELQNQIVNMTKDFVKFNKDLGEFQILPGEKRRLRELGEALGMSNGELQKMALNAANLDYKMKQIKFAPGTSKEDREMIATLAQINKQGEATVKVKQMVKDETTGEQKWTGEYITKAIDQLKPEEIEQLRKEQEVQAKSMEELAGDQLGELEKLNAQFDSFKKAAAYGIASSKDMQGLYSTITTGARESLFGTKDKEGVLPKGASETENWRKIAGEITGTVADGLTTVVNELKTINSFDTFTTAMSNISTKAGEFIGGLSVDGLLTKLGESFKTGGEGLKTMAGSTSVTSLSSNVSNATLNTNNSSSQNIQTETNEQSNTNNTQNLNINMNVDIGDASKNQALTELMYTALQRYFSNDGGNQNIATLNSDLNKLKTANNLVISENSPK